MPLSSGLIFLRTPQRKARQRTCQTNRKTRRGSSQRLVIFRRTDHFVSTDHTASDELVARHARPNNAALAAELNELLSVVEPASVANMVLQRAFAHGATDIHLDPTTLGTRIRFRVDGTLQVILPIPADKAAVLLSRIRVMANMDITDRRRPSDGAISADRYPGLPRDIRVDSTPTINGERLVLRLMPDAEQLNNLTSLGFYDDQLSAVRTLLDAPYGLMLVVGPVGSGKSTTVHCLLKELNSPEKSVVTIEDPVERRIPGINQIQIDTTTGLTFVNALRGTLRQDPNIICVEEIRDPETAQIACRAATTGVLVVSTLHANNTASAVDVLRGFGISSMSIADCLRGVVAQRLIRKVCDESREEVEPDGCCKWTTTITRHESCTAFLQTRTSTPATRAERPCLNQCLYHTIYEMRFQTVWRHTISCRLLTMAE
jgi:type II secretory ATPase GspE/PulE/Tfp pilus assembly ATPase PilB-like protein